MPDNMIVGTDEHHLGHVPCVCDFCRDLGPYDSNPGSSRLYVCSGETVVGSTPPYPNDDVIVYMADPNGERVRQYSVVSELHELLSPHGLLRARDRARNLGIIHGGPSPRTVVEGQRYPRPFRLVPERHIKFIGNVGIYDVYTYDMKDYTGWLLLHGPERTTGPEWTRTRPRELKLHRSPGGEWVITDTLLGAGQTLDPIEEDRQALLLLNGHPSSCQHSVSTGDALERLANG